MGDELKKMFVVIGLRAEGLTKGLKQSRRELQTFATGAITAGVAITGAIGMSVKAWAKAGDEVNKLAQKTGIGTEALSELRYAADLSGGSIQGLEVGFKKMASVIADAAGGNKEAIKNFKTLGISIDDLMKMSPEERFKTLAGAIADISDPTLRAAMATDVFGKSGTDLLPMLSEGASGLKRLYEEARELGIVFDQETANAATKLNDSVERLGKSLDGLKFTIGAAVAPSIQGMADDATEAMKAFNNWAKENPGLATGLTDLTGKLGLMTLGVGGLIKILPTLIGMWKSLGGLGGLIGMGALGVGMVGWGVQGLIDKAEIKRKEAEREERFKSLTYSKDKLTLLEKENLEEYYRMQGEVTPGGKKSIQEYFKPAGIDPTKYKSMEELEEAYKPMTREEFEAAYKPVDLPISPDEFEAAYKPGPLVIGEEERERQRIGEKLLWLNLHVDTLRESTDEAAKGFVAYYDSVIDGSKAQKEAAEEMAAAAERNAAAQQEAAEATDRHAAAVRRNAMEMLQVAAAAGALAEEFSRSRFMMGAGGISAAGIAPAQSLAMSQLLAAGPLWALNQQERAKLLSIMEGKDWGAAKSDFLAWYKETTGIDLYTYASGHFGGANEEFGRKWGPEYGEGSPTWETQKAMGQVGELHVHVDVDGKQIAEAVIDPLGQMVLERQRMGG